MPVFRLTLVLPEVFLGSILRLCTLSYNKLQLQIMKYNALNNVSIVPSIHYYPEAAPVPRQAV